MNINRLVLALVAGTAAAHADAQYVMMGDSTNERVVLFNPFDGSVVNSNYFATQGGTTVHAMQVNNEIWISEQIGDRISRWSLSGTYLGAISGGLDNIRGMARIGDTVYLTNSGTANGAPGPAIVRFDTEGNNLGSFSTGGTSPSPFGILAYGDGMLVSSSSANDDIHHFSLDGTSLGTFHNSTALNFAEQMIVASNGDILVAGFSSNNIVRLDAESGAVITTYSANGARGLYELGNGNLLWTNGTGVHVMDLETGGSTLVYAGGGRYLDFLLVPAPGFASLLGVAGLFGAARRRR